MFGIDFWLVCPRDAWSDSVIPLANLAKVADKKKSNTEVEIWNTDLYFINARQTWSSELSQEETRIFGDQVLEEDTFGDMSDENVAPETKRDRTSTYIFRITIACPYLKFKEQRSPPGACFFVVQAQLRFASQASHGTLRVDGWNLGVGLWGHGPWICVCLSLCFLLFLLCLCCVRVRVLRVCVCLCVGVCVCACARLSSLGV